MINNPRVWLFVTQWTVACQAPLSMGFSRQEQWSGLPCPPPGDLPTQGSNPCLLCLLHWQVSSLPLSHQGVKVYFSPVFYQGECWWSGSFLCRKIQELGSFHFVNYIVCPPLTRSLESSLFNWEVEKEVGQSKWGLLWARPISSTYFSSFHSICQDLVTVRHPTELA